MSKYDGVVGVLGVAAGLVGIGFAWGTHTKMAKISEKLDRSIEDLAGNTPVDIPNDMIERAVEKAVEAHVKQAVKEATDVVVGDAKKDIHRQVRDVVESEYSDIKDKVLETVVTEAAKIDVKRVRADVEKAAKAHALEKFDDNLDDILAKHNSELENVTKIYKAIADAMTPVKNDDREVVLRLAR